MKKWYKAILYFVNFILYLTVIALWISVTEEITLNTSITVFNICLTMVILIIDHQRFEQLYTSSWFKGLRSSLITIFLVFGILGFINYLGYKNPRQIDLSFNKVNSLTEQSIDIVNALDKKLYFKIFSRKNQAAAVMGLLEVYRFYKSDIEIKFIDIELNPGLVNQYEITHAGTTVVEYMGRKEKVIHGDDNTELQFTNAILRLSRKKDPIIYFSVDHQEIEPREKGKNGISKIIAILQKAYFKIKAADIVQLAKIPKAVDALVIWGPKSDFQENEISVVTKYLKDGGKLLVALDPDLNGDKIPRLRKLISDWGVTVKNDLVVDKDSHINGSNATVPLIQKFISSHPIMKKFKGPVFFPLVSSVTESQNAKFRGEFTSLIFTNSYPASWAENTPREILDGKVVFHEGDDRKGPISLAGIWEGSNETNAKLAIFGNSTFIINGYERHGRNFSLFIDTLSWLVKEKGLVSFNLPIGKNEPVFISSGQLGIIFYFSVIFAPVFLIALAVLFYRRRKKT